MVSPRRAVHRPAVRGPVGALLGLLIAPVLGLAVGLGPAAALESGLETAPATRCESPTLAEAAKKARAVFTATVQEVVREPLPSGGTDFATTLSVERVYKPTGSAVISTDEVQLRTQLLRADCSLGVLRPGQRYLVFATLAQDQMVATGDSGTTVATATSVAAVEQLLGRGRSAVPPEPVAAVLTATSPGPPTTFVRAAAPGAGLVLVGLLGLLLVRRLGRRS